MIFTYLILFSIFNSVYMDSTLEPNQPTRYDIENVAVKPISCSFFISGYYERTPRYICYLLLVFTVVIRNHKWLAAGAAASMLTYSGIAAVHMIVLFTTNNRLKLQKGKSHCESLPTLGVSTPFVACTGVYDPDVDLSETIVSSVMLGALPIVAWSTTFRRSTSKAILIFWLLLMAMGHTFYPLIESNPGLNFQICPKDYIETLPSDFHAPLLDQSWRDSFSGLISAAQESSRNPRNGSSPACIYSCFATAGYSGRKTQDITVWDSVHVRRPIIKGHAANRLDDNAYNWSYTILDRISPTSSVTDIAIKGTKDPMFTTNSSEDTTSVTIHITVLKVVQSFTQCVSAAVFCGNIIQREMQNAHEWSILSQEPFGAVGQWGNIAIVLLVLLAAGISRFWAGLDDKDTKSDFWRDNENEYMEMEKEDWDWRIGYAS